MGTCLKSFTYLVLVRLYKGINILSGELFYLIIIEAIITALFAPIVVKLLEWGAYSASVKKKSSTESFGRTLKYK